MILKKWLIISKWKDKCLVKKWGLAVMPRLLNRFQCEEWCWRYKYKHLNYKKFLKDIDWTSLIVTSAIDINYIFSIKKCF